MPSLATSKSKKPSAQPPNLNARLALETALRRSLFPMREFGEDLPWHLRGSRLWLTWINDTTPCVCLLWHFTI
jgi:hypothetical protein